MQAAILHSLLKLLVLELGRIEGGIIADEGRWIKHRSACIGVEEVEACAIMILDGGVIHPGTHSGK